MNTVQELIQNARTAIAAGKLDEAERHTKAAKALRDVESLESVVANGKQEADELAELRAFKTRVENEPAKKGGVQIVEDETDKQADRPFKSFGEQMFAVARAALRPDMIDERLVAQQKRAKALGASEGVPSDGGFLVQTDFAAEILRRMNEMGQVMNRVRRVPIGANANGLKMNAIDEQSRANGSRWGGITGYWLAEAGSKTASKPKFRQMELNLKKLAGVAYATDELLSDTTALGAVLTDGFSEELMFLTEDSIFNGTGAGQPLGVLNSGALVTVAKENNQAAKTILVANIVNMWSRMWARSRANAVWFINQDIEPQLYTIDMPVGTGGVPVYLPPGGLSQTPYGVLLGRPVVPVEYCATLGTVGDIVLADLSQYILIEKGGVQAQSSIHVQFLTDETTFRFVYRVDGAPTWNTTLTPAKGTNTLSPFVALATRS